MAAIKNFFEKRKLQAKFKMAGPGQKLSSSDLSSMESSSRVAAGRPSGSSHSKNPSEESRKAAAAALARIDKQQQSTPSMANRSQQVIHAEAMKRLAAEKAGKALTFEKSSEPKEVYQESASVLSVSGVYFKCALVTPEVLPKSEIQQHIRNFLYEQLNEDREVTPCYMIHTLNRRDKVPPCILTLSKYIENILENPSDQKYQKIRVNNRVFQEKLAGLEGVHEFLTAAGFELKKIAPNESAEPEDFYVFNPELSVEAQRLLDILQSTEPILPELDRNIKVFAPSSNQSKIELPAEFFNFTAEDLKREHKLKSDLVEKNSMLRTKAMRERDEIRELRHYKYTLIRIRFPDGVMLQGTFSVYEKFSAILEFVRSALVNDWQPFILTTSMGQHLTEEESTLLDLHLVPAAVVHFAWDPEVVRDLKRQTGQESDTYLQPTMIAIMENLSLTNR